MFNRIRTFIDREKTDREQLVLDMLHGAAVGAAVTLPMALTWYVIENHHFARLITKGLNEELKK